MTMNSNEIKAKKLILKFINLYTNLYYDEYIECSNKFNVFEHYCGYWRDLTKTFRTNFNNNNKNNNYLLNYIDKLWDQNPFDEKVMVTPSDLLYNGLDFNDNALLEYLEYLII